MGHVVRQMIEYETLTKSVNKEEARCKRAKCVVYVLSRDSTPATPGSPSSLLPSYVVGHEKYITRATRENGPAISAVLRREWRISPAAC